MHITARDRTLGHLAMLLFALVISGSFSLGSRAAGFIAPEALNTVRFAIAVGALGAAASLGPGLRRAQLAAPWRYVLLGFPLAAYFVLMFAALRLTDPVSTGAMFTLTPLLSAGFAWIILRQVMPPRMAAALTLGAAGAVWVIFRGDVERILSFDLGRGEGIYFVGVVLHSVYTPLLRKLNRGEPVLAYAFWTVLACFGWILGYALWTGSLVSTEWAELPPIVWIATVYVGLGASALTTFLLQFAAMRLPAGKVMAYGYLTPSVIVLWEGIFGGDWPRAATLAGIAATIVAMLLLLKNQETPRP